MGEPRPIADSLAKAPGRHEDASERRMATTAPTNAPEGNVMRVHPKRPNMCPGARLRGPDGRWGRTLCSRQCEIQEVRDEQHDEEGRVAQVFIREVPLGLCPSCGRAEREMRADLRDKARQQGVLHGGGRRAHE